MGGRGFFCCLHLAGPRCHRFKTFSLNLYATIRFFFVLALCFYWDRDLNIRNDSNALCRILIIHGIFQNQFKILALSPGASMSNAGDSAK